MKRIIVVGGGFAGMWSAVSAARQLHEMQISTGKVEVMLINKDAFLGLRPRFYEKELQETRVSLKKLLDLAGVRFVEGEVTDIDIHEQNVTVQQNGLVTQFYFDRMVLAAGSQVIRPNITGLREYAYSTDSYTEAMQLDKHIKGLVNLPEQEGKYTAVVIGGGFTGLEVATEMTERLKDIARQENKESEVRVIVIERSCNIAKGYSNEARSIIENALGVLKVEVICNQSVIHLDQMGVTLESGKHIASLTTIWSGGVKANPLVASIPIDKDAADRLPVNEFLQVIGLPSIYAAGDTAVANTDEEHVTMMSCQHAVPMGKFAGHNVVCDLLGIPRTPYKQIDYVTCLDLGPWGALYTTGWDRTPVFQGEKAKELKQAIIRKINPIVYEDRDSLFQASRPAEVRLQ